VETENEEAIASSNVDDAQTVLSPKNLLLRWVRKRALVTALLRPLTRRDAEIARLARLEVQLRKQLSNAVDRSNRFKARVSELDNRVAAQKEVGTELERLSQYLHEQLSLRGGLEGPRHLDDVQQ
jgi:hypothetical protein